MKVRFAKPGTQLSTYIERYWSWENEATTRVYLPHIPPGVGIDLFFHYKNPFEIADKGVLPSSHLIFSGDKSCKILPAAQTGFLVARFRCSMFRNFTPVPLHQLADTFVDAYTIWGSEGKDLEEQIGSADSMGERIRLLEAFLYRQLGKYGRQSKGWDTVVHTLYYHHEEARLNQLAKEMNISPRHFRRIFFEISGMTPKHFQQLCRFKTVLRQLLINNDTSYLPVALEHGYFDQMHFIKEFKRLMNTTPSAFLTAENLASHFYYKRLE
ncbi:helix-turn-helix domain-containing protein [Chitinophagaceae bacterium MMS25-I14]